MSLVVGSQYYWLTADQYSFVSANDPNNLTSDFILAPDGYYYAAISDVDDEELDFLLENGLGATTFYSKSTQPGGSL